MLCFRSLENNTIVENLFCQQGKKKLSNIGASKALRHKDTNNKNLRPSYYLHTEVSSRNSDAISQRIDWSVGFHTC